MERIILLFLLLSCTQGFTQELKQKTESSNYLEAHYSVLKSDRKVKHGSFELYYRETLLQRGTYDNNKKSGIWQFFDYQGALVHRYNYKTGQLFVHKNETAGQISDPRIVIDGQVTNESPEVPPIFIGGNTRLLNDFGRSLNYPVAAKRAGTEGEVIAEATITQEGDIIDEKIIQDIGNGCGDEVLRLLELVPNEWKPAKKNGEPVAVRVKIKTRFVLR